MQCWEWAGLAAGDASAARDASEKAWQNRMPVPQREPLVISVAPLAEAAAACGDLTEARRWSDAAVSKTRYWHLINSLAERVRVAMAEGEPLQAERHAFDALAMAVDMHAHLLTPDLLESLGILATQADSHREAARLLGAADAMRRRNGIVRFKIHEPGYEACLVELRNAMAEGDFDAAWAEGASLSTEEAVAYALRGRGERKRPTSGWESLTPTERDVVRLASEGLGNKDIATRLFISHRTVQSHLTHVYTKLGLSSRVQLVQEAARHD